jgi:predicted PurR-regulated permease PerM
VEDDRNRVLGPSYVARAARWGILAWATIGMLLIGYFAFRYVVYPIRIIFPPLVVALIMLYVLNPLVSGMERRGMRRGWATLLVYLAFLAVVGTGLFFLVPLVVEQVDDFVRAAPEIFRQISEGFQSFFARFGFDVQPTTAPASSGVLAFLGDLVSLTRPILDIVLIIVVGPILAFYLMMDLPKIRRGLKTLVPVRRRREVEDVTGRIGQAIGSFFRGQLLVAIFVGVVSAIGLWIVGLPYWALVGLVSGLFNLIPLIGPIIGTVLAVLVATTTDVSGGLLQLQPGLPLAIGSAVVLLVVQQIDNHVLSPNIVGRTVNLHPVTVLLGLLAGGTLLGLWGMLLAVPVMASLKILILHVWDTRATWPPQSEEPARPEPSAPPGPRPEPPAPERRPAGVMGWLLGSRETRGERSGETAPPEEPAETPTEEAESPAPTGSRARPG